ncbi:MAG: YerC/YecD family TrpR-related protein [Clostridiales bacterium]|nr:YerC/YecD family TrpR-related protein [Clostridiales bacterium]
MREDSGRRDFFYECILSLKTKEDCEAFFADAFTRQELNAVCQRTEVARLLELGKTYNLIAEETGASTATISRVNRCLNYGENGYKKAINKVFGKA